MARSYRLWGLATEINQVQAPTSTLVPPISVNVPLLAQRIVSLWVYLEYYYEFLLRLRWESRGRFCLVFSTFCLIGLLLGDVILPYPAVTILITLSLTLPALVHHRLHLRLLRRFAPILMELDLAIDIRRRPLGTGAAGDRLSMRGSRQFDESRLQDIDEVSDRDSMLDDEQATDGEDMDLLDEQVETSIQYNPTPVRNESRDHLVQSHLELPPDDNPLIQSDQITLLSKYRHGDQKTVPPSLFTTNNDLQDLGLLPFDERVIEEAENSQFKRIKDPDYDSTDEATGLTPDWSREASGDEDDDTSLMEFLPEGVTRMPSITPSRDSRKTITEDHLMPRQYIRAPKTDEKSDELNMHLISAGSNLLASITNSSGVHMQQTHTSFTDNLGMTKALSSQEISYQYLSRPAYSVPPPDRLVIQSQIEEALLDDANGNPMGGPNRARRGLTPGSSVSSDENSGFEILDRPDADHDDDVALLEAAMREEGL